QDGKALALGKDLHVFTDAPDARGANKDHLHGAAGEGGRLDFDGRVDLAAVGIALDGCVKQGQGALRRIQNLAGKKDGAGTGAEDGTRAAEPLQSIEQTAPVEELEHGGGLAAG